MDQTSQTPTPTPANRYGSLDIEDPDEMELYDEGGAQSQPSPTPNLRDYVYPPSNTSTPRLTPTPPPPSQDAPKLPSFSAIAARAGQAPFGSRTDSRSHLRDPTLAKLHFSKIPTCTKPPVSKRTRSDSGDEESLTAKRQNPGTTDTPPDATRRPERGRTPLREPSGTPTPTPQTVTKPAAQMRPQTPSVRDKSPPPPDTTPGMPGVAIPIPPEGFPTIHGMGTLELYKFISHVTQAMWEDERDPCVAAYIAQDRITTDDGSKALRIKAFLEALPQIIGECPEVQIGPPEKSTNPSLERTEHRPAFPYLLYGLTHEQKALLLSRRCWMTRDLVFFAFDKYPPPTTFVTSLSGFPHPPTDASIVRIRSIIQKKIINTPEVVNFIAIYNDNIPTTLAFSEKVRFIRDSVNVTCLEMGRGYIYNLYIHPPTLEHGHHNTWVDLLRKQRYPDVSGVGKPLERPLGCNCCKARDHPTGHCPYTRLTGWRDSALIVAAREAASQTSTNQPGTNTNPRGRGYTRGRGSGRGTRGGRGGRGNAPFF